MYGNLVLLEETRKPQHGQRIYVGDEAGTDEAWLRDLLFDNPDIIPINEIDGMYGPLIPLFKEFRVGRGRVDALFINPHGRVTLLVVAQAMEYATALSNLSYYDLQQQVENGSSRPGVSPFSLAQKQAKGLIERHFVEAVNQSLKNGRILSLIAGDGVRGGAQNLADFLNLHTTKAYSFGLLEVALYRFAKGRIVVQPRVTARTEVHVRHVTLINGESAPVTENRQETIDESVPVTRRAGVTKGHLKTWWQPLLDMKFDNQEQESPSWRVTNNLVLKTPFRGVQIKAYATVDNPAIGVFVSGQEDAIAAISKYIRREQKRLQQELPDGTEIRPDRGWPIVLAESELKTDPERYAWLQKSINAFVNVLRPRFQQWYRDFQAS